MNRGEFVSKPGKEPKPLKIALGGYAELSLKAMREIAKIHHDHSRDEVFDTRIVRLNKFHAPTQTYLVDFEHLWGFAVWVNAEEIKVTAEEWQDEKPPLDGGDNGDVAYPSNYI